ncbi:MAG: family 20 glycosylhydrolase [Bacteroidales bacterium]
MKKINFYSLKAIKTLVVNVLIICIVVLLSSCNNKNKTYSKNIHIIPEPNSIVMKNGVFEFNNATKIVFVNFNDEEAKKNIEYYKEYFEKLTGRKNNFIENSDPKSKSVNFILSNEESLLNNNQESYIIDVFANQIDIISNTLAGLFYGFQSFCQLVSFDKDNKPVYIPCLTIEDEPAFKWRGTHLDVCRHFFDIDFLKKYIDILSINKINKFHWHLTDDHGWRIEIDKYPKLTEIGAWRVDRSNVPWLEGEPAKPGEPTNYGGYYTKEQIKDLIEYAAVRNIEIIPEIELPGHSSAILVAYPEYACDDYKYEIPIGPYWPPKAILCGGNDDVMTFLFDVLDEVMDLFPSNYIHIGGDEAYKQNWEVCEKCQNRIKELGLKDEKALQGWMVNEVEKHVIEKGKRIIGWDEILDGNVSKTAIVMSWRGIDGGITAAKQGNEVIMAPNNFCYFDYYQADPCCQPTSIGGFVPLKKVYEFNPIPQSLSDEEAKLILGGQCNLWTEFIFTPDHVEYMLLPRLGALSESVWTKQENKSWEKFKNKVVEYKKLLDHWGYNYCEGSFKPIITTHKKGEKLYCELESEVQNAVIYYTLDKTTPDNNSILYTEPIEITEPTTVTAITYYNGEAKEIPVAQTIYKPQLNINNIDLNVKPSEKYAGNGLVTLFDGIEGDNLNFNDNRWLGFQEKQVIINIKDRDFDISNIQVNMLINQPVWIFLPQQIIVSTSNDNKEWKVAKEVDINASEKRDNEIVTNSLLFDPPITEKYVRITFNNLEELPDWHDFAGETPWLFIDEVLVY